MRLDLLLDLAADAVPDRTILQDGERHTTAEGLRELAASVATELLDGGHDSLVFVAPWGLPYAAAAFGASLAGVPMVPLSYRLGRDQLGALLANHPRALVVSQLAGPLGSSPGARTRAVDEWIAAHCHGVAERPDPVTDASAPAVLLYTSGTTAAPKAAVLRHHHLVSYVMTTVDLAGAGEDEAVLVTAPPYHVAGLANLLSHLFAGRRMVASSAVDGNTWLDAAVTHRATHAFVVPTLLQRILAAQEASPRDLSTLRALAYGGARTPPAVIGAALAALPHVDLTQAYGLTETSSTIAVLGPDDHRAALGGEPTAVERLGSVGRLVPGIELEVRGGDGRPLAPGSAGRIWLRGPQVSGEYANAPSAVDDDGWFDTRDRGHLDGDGYLFVEGRDDDTIIRGAENIAPAEIEDVLLGHPSLQHVAVVGLPDAEWGQVPAAAVVASPGVEVDPDEVLAWARARLRSSKTPVRLACWDELPMTDNGKVLRRAVLARLLEPSAP